MGGEEIPRVYDSTAGSSPRRQSAPAEAMRVAEGQIGRLLASKYRLTRVLGVGGMGWVFAATNEGVGRTVAIKMLQPKFAAQPSIVERFLREARTANRVRHANVVDVLDIARDDSGAPFLVQEYLEGETLLEYSQGKGLVLSVDEVLEILGPVIAAVAAAHAGGVVHRDLKPENVFIAKINGTHIPKLVDFGISKVRISGGDEAEAITETAVGVMLGTPPYMAPELVRGAREADPRSDVWALGVIMFELVTGTLPFNGRNVRELFERISTAEPPQISSLAAHVPRHLSEVIAKCLRKDPAHRYADGAALAAAFAEAREKIATAKRLREQRAALIGMAATVRSEPESGPVSVEVRTAGRDEPLVVVPDPSEMTVRRRRPPAPSSTGRIVAFLVALAILGVVAVVAVLMTRGRL